MSDSAAHHSLPVSLLRMVRFSHSLFALPWAATGVLLALPAAFHWKQGAGVLLCMLSARTAAMTFNRLVDRRFDATNPRTAARPSVTGAVSQRAMVVLIVLSLAAFVASSWWINPLCGKLSVVALAVVLGYSYTKRFSALCHFVLGAGLGLAPVGAYLALRGEFDSGSACAVAMGFAVLFWTAGFDILYALADMKHDLAEGLHSVPAALGVQGALVTARLCHAVTMAALVAAMQLGGLGWAFAAGIGIAGVLLVWEHRLVRAGDLTRLDTAFFRLNVALGFVMLLATGIDVGMRSA